MPLPGACMRPMVTLQTHGQHFDVRGAHLQQRRRKRTVFRGKGEEVLKSCRCRRACRWARGAGGFAVVSRRARGNWVADGTVQLQHLAPSHSSLGSVWPTTRPPRPSRHSRRRCRRRGRPTDDQRCIFNPASFPVEILTRLCLFALSQHEAQHRQ